MSPNGDWRAKTACAVPGFSAHCLFSDLLSVFESEGEKYMRLRSIIALVILLSSASIVSAQTVRLRGTVLDPSGAVLPGAHLKAAHGARVVGEGKSDATGNFSFDIPVGDYKLDISAAEFT